MDIVNFLPKNPDIDGYGSGRNGWSGVGLRNLPREGLYARSLFCFPSPFCMFICVLFVNFNRAFPSNVQVSMVLNIPYAVKPSPPGLMAHPWVPEGGGGGSRILQSREPLVVESRARQHSNGLHKTRHNHLSELKIEFKCEVKFRSKVKIWRFDVFGPGDKDYRTWWLKLRQNVVKDIVKILYEYKWHTKKTSRSRSGHKRSLYLRIVINPRPAGGGVWTPPPLRFFEDSKKTAARSAAGFSPTLSPIFSATFVKILTQCHVRSGHQVRSSDPTTK